jgi:hypothetical protein
LLPASDVLSVMAPVRSVEMGRGNEKNHEHSAYSTPSESSGDDIQEE